MIAIRRTQQPSSVFSSRRPILVSRAFSILCLVLSTFTFLSVVQAQSNDSGLSSSVTDLEFGSVPIGDSSVSEIVISNNNPDSDEPIVINAVTFDGTDATAFATDIETPVGLPSGESILISVSFTPTAPGMAVGALLVSHTGATNLEIFTLSGEGTDSSISLIAPQADAIEAPADVPVGFGKSLLQGIGDIKPTTLQFGPDGRLYAADWKGGIDVYDVTRNAANDYTVAAAETITVVKDIINHDDDGTPNSGVTERLVTGLLVVGTETDPLIYVNSSDPRIGGGPSHTDTNLDTNSGTLSSIRKEGGVWTRTDLVRGLPRSEENHHTNGLALDATTNTLYIGAGGHTNQGAPSSNFALLPEYALSAAILEVDLDAIGDTTYDLPTLDDETRPGANDLNDPFGGNNGLNQSMLVQNGPVQVYAPGFRNPYDIVITEAGFMYSIDNGPNAGWGDQPVGVNGPNCTNAANEPGATQRDRLHLITGRGYFGGHSNPTRGNMNNTFNDSNPQSPVFQSNPIECNYVGAGSSGTGMNFRPSTNGMVEYTGSNFGGDLKGDLLAVSYDNRVYRIELDDTGDTFLNKGELFNSVGNIPLDVTAQGDDDVFPGTIWVAEFVRKEIIVYEPNDYDGTPPVCNGDDVDIDEDGDGFTNSDEIDNGTNPCSSADLPPDVDGDNVSDLNDADDDNDGIDDVSDPFALDASNGAGRALPLSYTWENNSEPAGYLFNLGFSGLMINGQTNYQDQFDAGELTAGGAAGVFTLDNAPATDAAGTRNDQTYAFQFGVDVNPQTQEFEVRTRIVAPFAGVSNPVGEQSAGVYIGNGDQDNYVKLVIAGGSTNGMVKLVAEIQGIPQTIAELPAAIYGSSSVDLFLTVDPASGDISASFQIAAGGTTSSRVALGSAATLPSSWVTSNTGMAIGLISSSLGASPFTVTWDFIEVTYTANQAPNVDAGTDASLIIGDTLSLAPSVSDDGLPAGSSLLTTWSQTSGPGTATFGDTATTDTSVTFDAIGTYTLALEATDGDLSATDSLTVTVTDVPTASDSDGDGDPDASDPDDDNDGQPDTSDPFARDPLNGRGTAVPLLLEWDGTSYGSLFDAGFTGLMSNGSDYQSLYDPAQVSLSGGNFIITDVPPTDAYRRTNNQMFAFQLGIDVTSQSAPFTVRTRIATPFAGTTPEPLQSMGLYIGNGNQDNYIKLVANTGGPNGGLEFSKEVNKSFTGVASAQPTVYAADWIDLMLSVDPVAGTVSASYQSLNSGLPSTLTSVGSTSIPLSWFDGNNALAIGLISTSLYASPFDVAWDLLEVTLDNGN